MLSTSFVVFGYALGACLYSGWRALFVVSGLLLLVAGVVLGTVTLLDIDLQTPILHALGKDATLTGRHGALAVR